MILIDTSSWIHFLRPTGDENVQGRVEALLKSGEACWCPIVQLELWNGARGNRERKVLNDFSKVLPSLSMDSEVWTAAYALARRARASGLTIPATDILITACARRHGAGLESSDKDFSLLQNIR